MRKGTRGKQASEDKRTSKRWFDAAQRVAQQTTMLDLSVLTTTELERLITMHQNGETLEPATPSQMEYMLLTLKVRKEQAEHEERFRQNGFGWVVNKER